MRQYNFRMPSGFVLPGILGLVVFFILISVGLVVFGIVLVLLAIVGISSALYRALFGIHKQTAPKQHPYRSNMSKHADFDDIPFTEYKEIESGSNEEEDNGTTK